MAAENSESNTIIKVGPAGHGGEPSSSDSEWDLKGISKITGIIISFETEYYKSRITSLQFQYIDEDGKMKLSPVYGNATFAGSYFETVEFSNPEEYIIRLEGGTAPGQSNHLGYLIFETNYRRYGPFGNENKRLGHFNFRFGSKNHFAGFHGTFNQDTLSSIGVYLRQSSEKMVELPSVKAEVQSDNNIIKVGPGGWRSFYEWDAKGVSNITRIFISFGEDEFSSRINSLQFQYIEDGQKKLSPVYGSKSNRAGFNFEMVVLSEEKDEYITRLSGAALQRNTRVTSLTFETNLKKYGPFGSVPAAAKSFSFGFGPGNPDSLGLS